MTPVPEGFPDPRIDTPTLIRSDDSEDATRVPLRTLRIEADALVAMLKTHLPTVVHFRGLPEDARVVDVYPDPRTSAVVLLVWSSQFEPVDPGLPDLPECDVVAETLVLGTGEI